jgi:pyruvate kinase
MRRTKIIGTIGPASGDPETIKKLITAGMDAARVNFSHGTYESHQALIDAVKKVRDELNAPIPLILDTKGPEIRLGKFANEPIVINEGGRFTITTEDIQGDETRVSVTYKGFAEDLKPGDRVLADDGLIELKVIEISGNDVICEALNSGELSSNKGVNLPGVFVNLPSMIEKDIKDVEFGVKNGFDYIAASFIRSAADVIKMRECVEKHGGQDVKIIAKIENADGVKNIDEILEVADGVMVARGDLGVEMPPEEVPLIQKQIIYKANELGKLVVTATQMLESMISNPRPTRAEANDVANAIFDGSDVIMLSGETAKGKYPAESVGMMARIAERAENSKRLEMEKRRSIFKTNITNAVAYAACATARDLEASCVLAVTNSGITPRMISKFRPVCPVCAITKNERVWRQLNLSWGCIPILNKNMGTDSSELLKTIDLAKDRGIIKDGDYVVLAAGLPIGVAGTTNLLRVEIVGNILIKGKGYGGGVYTGTSNVARVLEQASKYFTPGDILVVANTNNKTIPYVKKCGALVVGSDLPQDYSHAKTVASALDIPLIICNQRVADIIPDGAKITVDSVHGFVYNGDAQIDA